MNIWTATYVTAQRRHIATTNIVTLLPSLPTRTWSQWASTPSIFFLFFLFFLYYYLFTVRLHAVHDGTSLSLHRNRSIRPQPGPTTMKLATNFTKTLSTHHDHQHHGPWWWMRPCDNAKDSQWWWSMSKIQEHHSDSCWNRERSHLGMSFFSLLY